LQVNANAEKFAEMALLLHDEPTVDETVERLLEYSLSAVACSYAGVSFVHAPVHAPRQVETIIETHPIVTALDRVRRECGDGPDVAMADQQSLIVDDTLSDRRWPAWASQVAEVGVRSVLSVRLDTASSTVGTLNLYDPRPHHFDLDDQAVAHVLARHAAIALATALHKEDMWQVIDARKLIGQAQGILMERHSLTADQAFSVLLRYSRDKDIKLRAVADRLVSTRSLPSETGDRVTPVSDVELEGPPEVPAWAKVSSA
jgi:GAF domain-containing protein